MERIVVEGIDGVGKSTTIEHLCCVLTAQGANVLVQAEPGTTELGLHLRRHMKTNPTSDLERVLMMYLSRFSMLDQDERGYDYIITDRCWLSTLAYQCSANPELLKLVEKIQKAYSERYIGGSLFIIDGTPELAQTRRLNRGESDQLENFDRAQAEAMYQIYRSAYTVKGIEYVADHQHLFKRGIADICCFVNKAVRDTFNHVSAVNAQWTTTQQVDFILRQIEQHRILDRGAVQWELVVN